MTSQPQREGRKIIDLIREKEAKDEVYFSFEYFPPRTDQGASCAQRRTEGCTTLERSPRLLALTLSCSPSFRPHSPPCAFFLCQLSLFFVVFLFLSVLAA